MLEDNRTISFKFWRKMISNVESFSAKLLAEITNTCSHSSKCGIKESACNAGAAEDPGLIPESGRSPGGGLGNSLQYSCLENPMDWGAWRATVHGVTKSRTRLSDWAHKLVKILHFHCRGNLFLRLANRITPVKTIQPVNEMLLIYKRTRFSFRLLLSNPNEATFFID